MTEYVAYVFIKKDRVLLEYREDAGKSPLKTIPKGKILDVDRKGSRRNEMEHALHRLIYASSKGTLIPLQYEFVKVCNDRENDSLVYVYFIYSWDGIDPSQSVPGGAGASCHFVSINEAIGMIKESVDKVILTAAKETIRIRSVLNGRFYR